jgi:hypothetical protein
MMLRTVFLAAMRGPPGALFAAAFDGRRLDIIWRITMLHRSRFPARPLLRAAIGVGAIATLASGVALAEPSPALDRASISAGAFYTEPTVKIGADTRYGRLDTANDSQKRATIPRIKADLLIGDTQGLSFDYYRYDKDYTPSVSNSIPYNGQQFSGTANVNGKLRLDLAQLAYKWWIGSGNDVFGLGTGAAYYKADLSGSAVGSVRSSAGTTVSGTATGGFNDDAFAPLLELGYRHSFSPQLRLVADASGVRKNGGKINGHIYSGTIGLEWFPWKDIGFVGDYGIQKIHLNRDGGRADLDVRLTGPSAYVKVRF